MPFPFPFPMQIGHYLFLCATALSIFPLPAFQCAPLAAPTTAAATRATQPMQTESWRDLAPKLKRRQDFQWSLSGFSLVCVYVCVVVFLRETIKKLNRKLASHFVLKGKFNIKGLHCTHGRQGAIHTHTHTRGGKSRVQRVPCKVLSNS